jgi:catechol 2,3-dioxygenase-like lactoylglutathione lyase family enzyme
VPQSLAQIALIVRNYDEAIAWFTEKLGFTLVADEPHLEQNRRWVLVAPPRGAGVFRPVPSPSTHRTMIARRLRHPGGGNVGVRHMWET